MIETGGVRTRWRRRVASPTPRISFCVTLDERAKTISPSAAGLTAQQIIQTYSHDEWEAFIEEWAEAFDPPYAQIVMGC